MSDSSSRTLLSYLHKYPTSNDWHPQPGSNPVKYVDKLPSALKRTDLHATVVDAAPFIAGAGGLAHASQVLDFGFTAPASIFRNVRTMTAIHRSTLWLVPVIFACQAAGVEYRNFIPRWAHERELRRDESEVRQHVDVGMAVGALSWVTRIAFKFGTRYWAPIEVVLGGALADLMHREYVKAHGF